MPINGNGKVMVLKIIINALKFPLLKRADFNIIKLFFNKKKTDDKCVLNWFKTSLNSFLNVNY